MTAAPVLLQLPDGVSLTLPAGALAALVGHLKQMISSDLSQGAGEDCWMGAKDAAKYLGYGSTSTLHKLTAARQVPFEQDIAGGKLWFKRSDLDEWRRRGGPRA